MIEPNVSVLTGGSSGLGAAIARRLAQRGHRVGLIARREDALRDVAESIRAQGGHVEFATADVNDHDALERAITQLADRLGPIDQLIASAGIAPRNPAVGFATDRLAETFAVNVIGAAHAFALVLPSMIARRRGRIAGISSLAGFRAAMPGQAGYSASKAALSTLMEGLRLELQPHGVGVTAVHPGFVDTPMTAGAAFRPFLIDADRAAAIVVRGLENGRSRIDFPIAPALLMRLFRVLPDAVHARLVQRFWPSD